MTSRAAAAPHHLSAEAGRLVLATGGNAVDAAISMVATQGVVAPETCGLGGDLFALVHRPGWPTPRALNASGRAGSNVDPEGLRRDGHTEIPPEDPATVTIPGCVAGLAILSSELGSLSLGDALSPAIELANSGFEVSTEQSLAFTRQAGRYRHNQAVDAFYPGGVPVKKGTTVRRPSLGFTLSQIADHGPETFYLGRAGEDIVEAVSGLITVADLEQSHADWITPISAQVAGLSAWTIPPNSQGYLGPGTLAVFEMLDPPQDPSDPRWWHLLIEANRCLSWERNDLVADPLNAPLPMDLLLDQSRLQRAAETVSETRAGVWPSRKGDPASTAFMAVADENGMAVSIIQSNYRGTGSPFGAARSGFLLQDRGGGFSLTPGHPNELGPGKRPLHTLSPTIWTDGTEPRWILGTRGGSIQPQLIAQVGARAILAERDLDEAQAAPRWAVSDFGPYSDPHLTVEPGVAREIVEGLRARGHRVDEVDAIQPGWGPVSIIELDGDTRRTARDPRVDTTAALIF